MHRHFKECFTFGYMQLTEIKLLNAWVVKKNGFFMDFGVFKSSVQKAVLFSGYIFINYNCFI